MFFRVRLRASKEKWVEKFELKTLFLSVLRVSQGWKSHKKFILKIFMTNKKDHCKAKSVKTRRKVN